MTREEARIKLIEIRAQLEVILSMYGLEISEVFDMAIKALEQEPKILDTLDFAIDASNGDTNYFVGFRNGLRYSKSLIDGKEPQFESCAEQEPCEECSRANKPNPYYDCVSRQNAIDVMWQELDEDIARKVRDILETQPSITPKPKTGHWIIKEGREQGYDIAGIKTWYIQIMCDKCGFIKTAIEGHTGQYNFCPNCGAKMESEE